MNPDEMAEELAMAMGEFELYRGISTEDKWRYLIGKVAAMKETGVVWDDIDIPTQ